MLAQNQTQGDVIRLYELEIPNGCQVTEVTWASYRRPLGPVGTAVIEQFNTLLAGPLLSPVLAPYANTDPYHHDVMLRLKCADGRVYLVLLGWGLQNREEWELLGERTWVITNVGSVNITDLEEVIDRIRALQESHPSKDYCAIPSYGYGWNCQSLAKKIVEELEELQKLE